MVSDIVRYTNTYASSKVASWQPVDCVEIRGIFGMLFLIGVYRGQHQPIRDLLANGRDIFVASFGINRFEDVLRYLRFDDRATRPTGNTRDKFAPFRLLFDQFVRNCLENYNPGPCVCVDEQLIPYRGRCPFRQYLPSKPDKYGMKLFLLVSVNSHYVLNAIPYCGRDADGSVHVGLAQDIVKTLMQPYAKSGLNVTTDNYFTSAKLATDLATAGITLLGTMRKTRTEVPPEMRSLSGRDVGSSLFCFSDQLVLTSYMPKRNKCVVLLSSMHNDDSVEVASGKPEMIIDYNRTKGAVDAVDQLCHTYSVQKRTRRWPLAYFYNCLNLAAVNAFALYKGKFPAFEQGRSHRRRIFLEKLGQELLDPWLRRRATATGLQRPIQAALKKLSPGFPDRALTVESDRLGPKHEQLRTIETASGPLGPKPGQSFDH